MYSPTNNSFQILDGIITFEKWSLYQPAYNSDHFIISFRNPEFVRAFGPWKAGYKPHDLTFDPIRGVLSESNNWQEAVAECTLILTPGESKTYEHSYSKKEINQ